MSQRYDTARLIVKPLKVASGTFAIDRKRSDLWSLAVTLKHYLYRLYELGDLLSPDCESATFIVVIFANRLINQYLARKWSSMRGVKHVRHLYFFVFHLLRHLISTCKR